MATSDYTLNLLKRFEGYTAKPKWDEKQYSVGYSTRWQPGTPVGSREDHERALAREAGKVDSYISDNVKVPLDDNKRAALTSFGFNLGPGAIEKLLPDINSGNWDRVGQRMLSFSRAGDDPNALTDRRRQEAEILLGAPLPESASKVGATSSANGASAPKQEGDMLNFLAALGGSGNIMSALGKGLGMESLTNAGGSNNVFGSLAGMFGGGQGQDGGQGQGNAMGDANMKLANQAMASASPKGEGMPVYQRKPIDLANLSKILQQRAQLGAGGVQRQPGAGGGLGAY